VRVAAFPGRLLVKLGPSHALGDIKPKESEGWHLACCGRDWVVWEKQQ
jgi:hypothetical protein